MASMRLTTNAPTPKALCASEHAKLISGTDGLFPDFGHHSEGEMGGAMDAPHQGAGRLLAALPG